MSATEYSGTRTRMRDTSCAAESEPPPRSKKSALRSGTARPSTACHCSASHTSVGLSPVVGVSMPGSGHGRAARSTLPDVRTGRSSTTARSGTTAAGRVVARATRAPDAVELALHHEVADEHGNPCLGRAHRRGRGGHAGQILQRRLHLAEFDPASAHLDLIVGAPLEDETFGIEAHEIARPVRAVPAERRHRGVLLEVLRGIEVAGEADAADDELAGLALGDLLALGVDDGERPAVEREPDPHRHRAVERCRARHDRRLGGAVRVPYLAAIGREPGGQLGRAGLPAEDEQSHILERRDRPHRCEGGDRRDHRDRLADQPRGEVLARPHERTRRGHQACAVAATRATSPRTRRRTRRTVPRAPGRRGRAAPPGGICALRHRRRRRPSGGSPRRPSALPSSPR